jgi:hypothetical protein
MPGRRDTSQGWNAADTHHCGGSEADQSVIWLLIAAKLVQLGFD